jgi:arabinofuranosyltransferase
MVKQRKTRTIAKDKRQLDKAGIFLTSLAGGLALLFLGFELVSHYSIVDDAYISFRYLDNWLNGEGLVFNPGERVEGYSNLLWIVLLAPLRIAGLPVEIAATTLSLIALAGLLWAVFQTARNLSNNVVAGWVAIILAAGSVHLARWTMSGMETVLFAALIALANQQLSRKGKHGLLSSAFFGLSTLTRLPGVLQGAVAFGAALGRPGQNLWGKLRRLIVPAGFFLLFPLGHLCFRLAYYGLPLPNTAYVKLGGDLSSLLPLGLYYFWRFLGSGGIILLLPCLLALLTTRSKRNWVVWTLALQVGFHTAYVIYVGGDFFEFGRFFVPIVPAMAVLGSMGILGVCDGYFPDANRWLPVAAMFLMMISVACAHFSAEQKVYAIKAQGRIGREKLARWIDQTFPADATLAINVAGLIPYRTRRYTIDMLGLNDRHIAQTATQTRTEDGVVFVGHFKHDGVYVCSRRPDIVIPGGAEFMPGRNFLEASVHPGVTAFPGDREFLRAPDCAGLYQATGAELVPGSFAVVYIPKAAALLGESQQPQTARQWFERGLALMNDATMAQAALAFERCLELDPDNSAAMTNLAYCYLRLGRTQKAQNIFEEVLKSHPRHFDALYGLALAHTKLDNRSQAIAAWKRYIAEAPRSGWKGRAQEHLEQLLAK